MKAKITIQTYVDTRTEEERDLAFYVKGFREDSEVWSGELDIIPEGVYLTKISVIAEGIEHPICEIPFAIGIGHWIWVPPEPLLERSPNAEELAGGYNLDDAGASPRLFRGNGPEALPAMAIQSGRRKPRFWLPFRHLWQR